MKKTTGGYSEAGFYVDTNWKIHTVVHNGDELPIGIYLRIPTLAVLPLAAVLGGLFVVYLPFAGLYMTGKVLIEKLIPMLKDP